MQASLCPLFLREESIEGICKYYELLQVFKGTPLEESTDNSLFISIMSLLDIKDPCNIEALADNFVKINKIKEYSASVRAVLDVIQAKFLEEFNKCIETPKCVHEAYILMQKDITEAVVGRECQDWGRPEFSIESEDDLEFPHIGENLYSAVRTNNRSAVVVQGAFSKKYQKHVVVKKTTSSNINNLDRLEGKLLQELTTRKCKNIVKLYGMFEKQVSDNKFTFELMMEKQM